MYFKAIFTKSTLWLLAISSLILGLFVYASIDKTVYVTEQLIVIPDKVESSTWQKVENALIADISEQSLYQDFSDNNSAYLSKKSLLQENVEYAPEPISVPSTNDEETSDKIPEPRNITTDINQLIENINTIQEVDSVSEIVPSETEEEVTPLEVAPKPVVQPETEAAAPVVKWTALAMANQLFPLAQEIITTDVTSTTETGVFTANNLATTVSQTEVTPSLPELETNENLEEESEIEVEAEEIIRDETFVTEEIQTDDSMTEEMVEKNILSINDACVGDENCKLYSTTFSGFSLPEFESGTFLSSAQLQISLAAQTKKTTQSNLQRFVVEYSYSPDEPWRVATVIDIADEVSNSINGGYFLVSLEKPAAQSQLSNLQVRVSYQGNIDYLEKAYIESLWLQVTSASFYEETDPNYLNGAIDYDRTLQQPKFHQLNNPDLDPAMSELPFFTLSYEPQQGFLKRAFNAVFSENKYAVDGVRLIDGAGNLVDIPIKIIYYDNLTWTLQFLSQPQKLVPGKYKLELVINENETLFIDNFEFYWGVLAVNTTKSMYFPNEEVIFNLAALTEKGDTICDASLVLKVIDPTNTIYELPVEQSGACAKNNVTDIPDYLAKFTDSGELGRYTIQLQHLNRQGKVVHKIQDHFEVREYIPYDIERTAPTRIYPPAPYDVTLNIKAFRSFVGDIVERVPRGFIFTETGGAEVLTLPDYTELVWRGVNLKEGEQLKLSYQFDAPDISPYMYLLGPLDMDGFKELRQWQIASDALTAIGSFTGTRTVAGTNLNQTPSPLQWSTSTTDTFYYNHSTSTNSHQVVLRQAGDYFLAVTLPQERTDTNVRGTRVGIEVRVNGVAVPVGLGRSGYITNNGASHQESSSHTHFLLSNVAVNDTLEVYVEGLTTINAADVVNVSGQASMFLEYIGIGENVFAATTTRTTNSTNLNQATEYAFTWTETRQDSGFVHSDTINPEQIIISNPGVYFVQANIPLTTDTTNSNILGQVRLDGVLVAGGQFKQGYAQAPATESDGDSSIHWSGIVVSTTTNQVLTFTAVQEARAAIVNVTGGFTGSVLIRQLPSTELIALRGTAVVGGTNWNPASAAAVQWATQVAKDATVFTHSTSSNSHQITIAADGDYMLSYNDALQGSVARANSRVVVLKNGVAIRGAQTKSHYIRNQNAHTESSGALVILLEGLLNGDVITVTTQQEAVAGTLDDSTDAVLLLWKKATLNLRPETPSMYNAPFDNIRFASTTPYFDFSATDPDGTSDIEYEFSIATTSGFVASTTFNSSLASGFSNTASSTDTSPFVEGNKIRFQLSPANALTDLTTYYWRVRARDVTGSGEFSDWSTTQSLTVDLAAAAPSWFQSYSGQFEGNTLIGTVSSGADRVQVDASVSSEILIVYGEGTVTTPRYRLWNGSAWGLEGSAQAVTNTINWVKTAASVSRDEYAMVTLDAANDAYAQIYSASTSLWGNLALLSPVVVSAAYRGIAVGYESVSGDAMAVSCTNSPNPVYRIWNGTSWSATSSITVSSLNNCNFLELASDPASDEMILVVRDTGTQYEALVWDGSAWIESRVIGSSAKVAREGIALAYEKSGDQAVVVVSNGTANSIAYTTWNGTEFSTNATQALGNDFEFGRLAADTDSDALALCYIDEDNDVGVLRWNGGVWATFLELETSGNADTGRPVDCEFETTAGRSDYLMAAYSDTVNVRYRAATSTVWSTEATIGTMEDSFWVQTERAGDGTIVAVALDDVVDNLNSSFWNGTTWSAQTTLETNLSSVIATPYEMYDMSAKRFQFSEGVVQTPPIDFTAVPNQPTWGDINFSTTEPFGTDVQVRVKYSNVGTCDAYIPDGALPGNAGGFDVTESPIDLVGVSTTTYSQICLEATITTLGSESAALEEWTLSWVRQPKLTQNRYRWYVNGSFLTPTDPWPTGATDIAENTPLDSSMAVNINDTIRLRMSVQGANVELPAFSEAFKLQYAEGFTCSNSLEWKDVGGLASTTALWRGYENSIVGSDWYSGSWGRRIKLTVPTSVVADSVTDFPVYVNLADLPSGFFTTVQSDGDDIRITASNGTTELPYELVAIDTSLQTGELHFKANLSSTTATEFYIYYANPSASGYAASATYGSRNVWTNGYNLRYSLKENPDNAGPQFRDSTSNAVHATKKAGAGGLTSANLVAGKIGDGINHTAANHGATFTQQSYAGVFTASMWWNASGDGFAIAGPAGAFEKMGPWNSPAGRVFARVVSSSDTSVTHPADGNWTHVVLTRDSANKVDLYLDGTRYRLFTDAAQSGSSRWENFGGENSQSFRGILDEIRFANVQRTQGWVTTEFNNQSNPTGFFSISPEELISDGRLLPSTILTDSDNPETYEEENPTRENQSALAVGDNAEWDFVLQNNGGLSNTNYCFRMVYEDGSLFNKYTNYPRLITNAPPLTPVLSAPFDNERLASTTPWFEFAADDELDDDVTYDIQVSTDYAFGSTVISNNSVTNFSLFTNLRQPSEKGTYTSGDTIRFISPTTLSSGTTYWWRVRAQDPSGSGAYSEWSTPTSFTVTTGISITTWFQTTGEQFATNNLLDTIANIGSGDTGLDSGFTIGTTTSTVIDYDDRDNGNAWGQFSFTNNVSSGSIRYHVEYRVSGENFALIPNVDLPGNSTGFNTSPVSLVNLNTATYNELRLVAVLSGNSTLPRLQDWTVTWSETIEIPTHLTPFDNAKVSTTTPSFTFFTIDPEVDDIQYEIQLASTYNFSASSTYLSGVDAGFINTEVGGDTSPFNSGNIIRYTAQNPLTNGNTYWWRVRARDPGGANNWTDYSEPQSFTIDISITTSIWFQTTGEQFETNELIDIETTAGAAQITSVITEVMSVYGEGTGQSPQYRLWNGSSWSTPYSAQSVGAQIRWLELKAAPTRSEYALGTLGTDEDVNFQIYDTDTDTWGNIQELQTASVATNKRTFNLAYETNSGDLLAIACNGSNAVYSIWNGLTWSATTSLALTNSNNCEFIQMASDPMSDEIIAVFRHDVAGTNDFEAMVWNGSSWGNAVAFGELVQGAHEGMAIGYEESGDQAIVAVSNGAATTLLYNLWNGSAWSGTTTHALGDHIEWAVLKPDVGTDRLALCYIDNDADIGVLIWSGSAWNTFTELDVDGNDVRGRAVDCEWQVGTNDGDLLIAYSDTIGTRYQTYNGSTFSGELNLPGINDTFEVNLVRAGNGLAHLSAYDDALTPDRINHSRWNGSAWSTVENFSDNSSLNGVLPYVGGVSMAAQIYPNFVSGSIRSTPINFADGSGPRWDTISWNNTKPGASSIEYRLYYQSAPEVFTLVPNAALAGNSAGFTTSPVDISALDRTIYTVLKLDAQFICAAGNCPSLENWSVAWSEGITVSGRAYEFDGVSTTTSGTVAVAVNGVLQTGKTGTILGDGTWSITNVTAFPGDTVVVYVDGALDTDESVGIATYNGVGNITGVELTKRHVTIGSNSAATTTVANFAGFDNTNDEDIFFTVGIGNVFTVCAEVVCGDGRLKIKSGTTFIPGASLSTHDFLNQGTFSPATNTVRVSGSWNNQGTFIPGTSIVIFTATSTTETITTATSTHLFYDLTFGETSGTGIWSITKPLQTTNNLTINFGTLARGTSTINMAGNLQIGASGTMSGLATTTFSGSGSNTWGDAKAVASSTNVGYVVIDGTAKTITLTGNVGAESVTIGTDDTLNASGSGFNINVYKSWINNNSFIPQTGTVTFVGTSTGTINRGVSSFNNLTFSGVGGNWSFSTTTLALTGNLSIATGTVTLPTGTTTIGGSFLNTGGIFVHNNGEVRMTSTAAGRSITQSGTTFLNSFYDLVFTGSGAWSFTESNATTTRNFRITAGTVTLPSGLLTVGADFSVTGTGIFAHNNGEVALLVQDTNNVIARTSSFNNLRTVGAVSGSWYSDTWNYRQPITIQASQIDGDLANFPVYVNLANLSSHFFTNVKSNGGDIRVTQSDGVTEVPIELVSINTGSSNGELYFRATSIASSTNTTFYLYYGNSAASGYASTTAYGARNVWSNGYLIVNHMGDLTTSSVLNSAGTITGTKTSANNPLGVTTGYLYNAQDHSGDSVQHTGTLLQNLNQYSVSMWFNPDALTGGTTDEQNFGRSLYGISPSGTPYEWLRVGGTANPTNLTLCAFDTGTVCNVTTGANLSTGNWHYVSVNAVKSGNTTLRLNGVERLSFTAGSANPGTNFTIGDLRPGRNINFDGRIDEVRVASSTRTNAWRDAEYRNMATSTNFYTTGGYEGKRTRVFADTNVTILGNLNLTSGGDATFPTGILSIGGSFSNNANFNSNNGTVRFNSTAGAETIDAGSSTFATLDFNSATGDFTVTQNATATVAVNLTNVQQFTLTSGRTLTSQGTFTNAANGANTTWAGSTLRLLNGTTVNLNSKTHAGDVYGTLEAASSTLVKMWNSSATSYVTSGVSGAVYSQDHAGVDGDLYIFGNYIRNTGTEFWSYATDFDGTALLASTSRQVDVRVSTSSTVGFTNASLNMVGSANASTTIDAQTGAFALSATNTTVTAEYFTVSGTNSNGLGLYASSTLSVFRDGFFTVVPGRTGITFSTSTINTNPSAQFFRIGFATTSPGSATNVTLIGTTTNFVWFREGSGNLYGEAFDGADANPGSIRFDDSSNSIVVSGVVYSDDGITPQGAPTCNGTTPNVRIVVNGGTYTASTTCAAGTGAYSFPAVNYIGDPKVVVYLDTNGGVQGSVVTKTPTGNITNMHIYANRVITRHQDVLPLTASDMQSYDYDDDTDLRFIAASTSLTLLPNTELYVFASTTFAPGGNITLLGNGNANSYEGTLQIGSNATFTASGTETHTLAGRFVMATTSTFTAASSTFVFNATTTGKSITSPNTITFNQLQFNGFGGGWNITAPLSILGDMHVATGTVTGTSNITLQTGSLYGNGVLSLGSGTTTINRTNTLGGTNAWTFNNLILGSGSIVGTTTLASAATTTILGTLTIANAHFLNAGNSIFDLAGTGNVLVRTGTLIEGTGTFRFSGVTANVPSINYYNLLLNSGAGSATYTAVGSGILVYNDLIIGGTASSTFNVNTNDPVLEVRGDAVIQSNGTLQASNSANFTILGDYTNEGNFVGNGGTVRFTGSTVSLINAGNSSFSNVVIDGTGNFSVNSHATVTSALVLTNHGSFTVTNGRTLAVGGQFTNTLGGASTNWATSTLSLFGTGTYSINASTTSDIYHNLVIAAGTQIRMWNSSASAYVVNSTGSLYSQDHAGVNGNVYVYGQLTRTTGNDYWSYATDFDGTNLTGGNERQVQVYFANGASAAWAGASLTALGATSATTTIQNQGSGTYGITFGTGSTVSFDTVRIRDVNSSGIVFAGSPTVNNFSRTDHLVSINSGSALTVGGTVINANEARNFTNNIFEAGIGVTNAKNVTATGTTISSWRFTNHTGNIAGEAFDDDPAGDPGYIVWDNSAALINVSGNVYSDEGVTVSTVCDGTTSNIRLVVAGLTTYDASCNASTGAYSISNVAFSPLDTLTLYINGETPKAANVSVAPISSISNMHLYHNRVIVRHENTDPLTIANMAVWDSSDDTDIPFTAVDAGTDTLSLPANTKLLIWTGKTFEPNGNVTLNGAGAGADYDGTLEAQTNARFRAKGTEAHSVGGSFIFGTNAEFTSASSTLTLTTTGASRTFDVNNATLHNLTVSGVGSYVVTDSTLNLGGSYNQSNGAITFGVGTTTIGASFNVTAGSFTNNGSPFVFTSTAPGNTVRFNNSVVASLQFTRSGTFTMSDTNATSTGSVLITSSTVTLPSGNFAIGGSFEKRSGTVNHNTSELIMTATSSATITASSSDLFAISFTGPAMFTITDPNITFLDSFTIASGTVLMASGTTAIGGSFVATGGIFNSASGTVLLNAASGGKTVNPGVSSFYNLQFGAPSGGFTLYSATTTNNLTIANANILTVNPGSTVTVLGVFTNSVGGVATTWTNTTLSLLSQSAYSINTRTGNGDQYGTLNIGANTDIRTWYSNAATTTVAQSGSLYSQDDGNIDGALFIYGDLQIASTTEYWNYSNDFDGTVLTGLNQRQVTVSMANTATTTVTTGSLQILGVLGNETAMQNQGSGTYTLAVNGGTLNANYYEFRNMDISGLQLNNLANIVNLSNGYFDLAVTTGSAITLSSTTLNANPSKIFDNVGFNATGPITGYNVNLVGETINAWRFTSSYGNIGGEGFDIDGIDACGSIRFDNSSCLLTSQTHFRWRNDDGGEGAPASEWFDSSFDYRTRVRVLNHDNQSYASTTVKVTVPYDSSMQSDFDDLRFTSSDGQTPVPFWIEKFTASTNAQVWVLVPNLPASDYATVFMYYGSSTASSTSNGAAAFKAFDDFEDASISEYSGDTSLFTTVTTPVYGGVRSLAAANVSGKTTDGIFRFDDPVAQGEIIRYLQYVNTTAGSGDEPCTLFAVQSPGTTNQNYAVCLEQFGVDRISLARNVENNDTSGVVLATTTVTYTTGWYEVEIDWQTNNSIKVSLFNSAGTLVASTSATDSNYTSGGYGFAFWFQNGAWDSFSSRARVTTTPTVFLGAKQADGGATWASALDGVMSGVPGDIIRLRMAVENSGLDVTAQQYRLEFAAKGVAPTCESVSSGSYIAVPNQSTCGTSPVCMQASTFITDGNPTTDLLFGTEGTFSAGSLVESPSNQTVAIDVDQDFYTELEYVVTPTVNATDAYCFRVTNGGSPLDFYARIAELGLQFDPSFSAVTLNNETSISLTPGTTTAVIVSGTVTDFNGFADLLYATATVYRSGAGAACTPDNNNCYVASIENNQCAFINCSGNSCNLSCVVNIFFHADPTDDGVYEGQEWLAFAEVEDYSNAYDFASASGVELFTLHALNVDSLINYGSLQADSNTGSFNPTTTVTNLGNTPIDVDIEGTNLSDGINSSIAADLQKVSTSTFTYNACVSCQQLSTSSPVTLGLNLSKPVNVTPAVETEVYWGIAVPFSASNAPHTGTNIFTAIGVN